MAVDSDAGPSTRLEENQSRTGISNSSPQAKSSPCLFLCGLHVNYVFLHFLRVVKKKKSKEENFGLSLVAQEIKIHLSMQGTQV